MIAVAMIAATKVEYWLLSIIPCDKPNKDAIVPKVSPVDISRVVYMASLAGDPKYLATGYTLTIFVAASTVRKNRKAAGAAIIAGMETR